MYKLLVQHRNSLDELLICLASGTIPPGTRVVSGIFHNYKLSRYSVSTYSTRIASTVTRNTGPVLTRLVFPVDGDGRRERGEQRHPLCRPPLLRRLQNHLPGALEDRPGTCDEIDCIHVSVLMMFIAICVLWLFSQSVLASRRELVKYDQKKMELGGPPVTPSEPSTPAVTTPTSAQLKVELHLLTFRET